MLGPGHVIGRHLDLSEKYARNCSSEIIIHCSIWIGYKHAANSCLLCFSYIIATDNRLFKQEKTFSLFPHSPECLDEAMETRRKVLYCFYEIFLKYNPTNKGKYTYIYVCVCVCVKLMSYLQTIVLCMHSRRSDVT